jgi:hypothetical protein
MANAATLSYLDYLMQKRQDQWERIQDYRDYAEGEQAAVLTDDQKILLVGADSSGNPNSNPEFCLNVCGTIIDVEADRLEVQTITVALPDADQYQTVTEEAGAEQQSTADKEGERLSKLVMKWWADSRMDEGQQSVFWSTCRDADGYLIAWYEKDEIPDALPQDQPPGAPRLAVNKAYDGEDAGVEAFYEDGNPARPMVAVKTWEVQRPGIQQDTVVRRRNVYYDNRVEKYISGSQMVGSFRDADWRALKPGDPDWDDGLETITLTDPYGQQYAAAVYWWTDTGNQFGEPLGIPVSHLRRQAHGEAHGRSAIADVVPGLQDAINDSAVSVWAAEKLSGFKVITATGFDPDIDGPLRLYPNAVLYKAEADGGFGQLGETDLRQLVEVKNGFIRDAAMITNTPLSFFNISGDIPAEGTLKQLEAGLLVKTKRNQVAFGNAIEDAVRMMLKLEAVFGTEVNLSLEEVDSLEITCEWRPAETRNETADIEVAKAWKELGVSDKFIFQKLGFTAAEIAEIETDLAKRRQQSIAQMQTLVALGEQNQPEQTAPPVGRNGREAQNAEQATPAGTPAGPAPRPGLA